MTAKTDKICQLLDQLDANETFEVAQEVMALLGVNQIVQLVLQLDDTDKMEIAAHLEGED